MTTMESMLLWKTGAGHCQIQKGNKAFFPKLDIVFGKTKLNLRAKLKDRVTFDF